MTASASDTIFLQRDIKVYVAKKDVDMGYEIPTLEGISFSQAINNATITLNEASPDGTTQRRGSAAFAESLAPAEWSFQTYLRPTKSASANGTYTNGDRDDTATHGAVEEFLWAALAGDLGTATMPSASADKALTAWSFGTTDGVLDFDSSNKLQLGKFDLLFALAGDGSGVGDDKNIIYHLDEAVVNEVTIDFDIDGIATCSWSGFAKKIYEVNDGARDANSSSTAGWFDNISAANVITPGSKTITEGNTSTSNFIQNRLSEVTIANSHDPNTNYSAAYTLTLTGGSITVSNNISYVTPSMMQTVNQPLGHITGSRTVSGNLTCYADNTADRSMDLFEDLQEASVYDDTNIFELRVYLGGKNATNLPNAPGCMFVMPAAHLDIPTHNIGDVVSFDIGFTALASNATHTIATTTAAFALSADATATNSLTGTNELFVVMAGL